MQELPLSISTLSPTRTQSFHTEAVPSRTTRKQRRMSDSCSGGDRDSSQAIRPDEIGFHFLACRRFLEDQAPTPQNQPATFGSKSGAEDVEEPSDDFAHALGLLPELNYLVAASEP